MVEQHNYPEHFIFRSVLKGLVWSTMGTLLLIWIIIGIIFLLDSSSPFYIVAKENIGSAFVGISFGLLPLSLIVLVFLGIPVMALPCLSGSLILAIWLFHDSKTNKLTIRNAQIRGIIFGALAGILGLFLPSKYLGIPIFWLFVRDSKKVDTLLWVILIVVLVVSSMTGSLFAKSLARELEPKGDYFSIDWEALQKEDDNLIPDI